MRIVTLTLSAAYDVHCSADKIEAGLENFVTFSERNAGGKGVNISRALHASSVASTAIVVLGEENSREFVEGLEKEGLTFEKILIPGRIRENITVHTADGKETRISFGATVVPESLIEEIERITDGILFEGDILTLTGSIPQGVNIEELKQYVKRQKQKGVKVIVDSRSFTFSDIMAMGPFLIKPNEYEVQEYIGTAIAEESEARLAAEELRTFGVENVMITLGGRGAALASSEGSFYVPAPQIEALSTIGAGDSAIAGFIYALSKGYDTKQSLELSVAFGTAACLKSGTTPPEMSDAMDLMGSDIFE